MSKQPHLSGKFIWFEHASPDPERALTFYAALFGWTVHDSTVSGQPYRMLMNAGAGIGGLRKAEPGTSGTPAHWLSYLSVVDVDERYQAALAAGARTLMPPTDFSPVGRGAGLTDPTGAALHLWRNDQGDAPDHDVACGHWVWNELWTPDARAALAFYETVFQFGHHSMDMGEQGLYHVLQGPDGVDRSGVTQAALSGFPPMWLPYVRVADGAASVELARRLGAREVLMPATDIPGVGTVAIVVDPLGAAVAMIRPDPRG
jgi:uncharacterized protein